METHLKFILIPFWKFEKSLGKSSIFVDWAHFAGWSFMLFF